MKSLLVGFTSTNEKSSISHPSSKPKSNKRLLESSTPCPLNMKNQMLSLIKINKAKMARQTKIPTLNLLIKKVNRAMPKRNLQDNKANNKIKDRILEDLEMNHKNQTKMTNLRNKGKINLLLESKHILLPLPLKQQVKNEAHIKEPTFTIEVKKSAAKEEWN